MDLRKIKTLIELLEASDLSEIEINEGEDSIRLSRVSSVASPVAAAQMPYSPPPAAPVASLAAPVATPAVEESAAAISGHIVESPTVGTFYARPSPDADAFVKVGDKVSLGATLCVVEAMKTFNEIQANKAGTIVSTFKSDGDPVEFGEALFVIE
ncbi:MAG: acetyl-CoA carboxylase biotin carboxyl carrier protein [Proteobacteria bacterium]|nr:acetyl-CoA carboxylase biotin carboxyl carrier protein [Pseudomonadota bacterium]